MSESRHNPDQLLKEIQADEENRNKGHLKIFFGYAAGVGKTYAMLEAAHMEKQQGIDVVAGYVETHARPKTAALLNGLEVLPTREVFYNGMILDEFDIGMALKRKPQLILVDELAHTNAEGCRHAKRYQDIKELLMQGLMSIRLSMFSILKAFVIQLHPLRKLMYGNAFRILFLIMQIRLN